MIGIDFNLEPKEAIAYLQQKGYKLIFNYDEMMHEAHHKAFTVAKVTRLDLLSDIHKSLLDAQQSGLGFEDWKKNIKPTLKNYGWYGNTTVTSPDTGETKDIYVGSRRLKTIYETNMRVAYNVANEQQMDQLPRSDYRVYKCAIEEISRHKQHHNHVYHKDDPFWATWSPLNAWGCRCQKRATTKAEAEAKGWKINEPFTPNTDKDWGYNASNTDPNIRATDGVYNKAVKALQETKQGEYERDWAKGYLTKVLDTASLAVDEKRYKKWADSVASDFKRLKELEVKAKAEGKKEIDFRYSSPISQMAVGALDIPTFDFLGKKNIIPASAAIIISRERIQHATREIKTDMGKAISAEQILAIPQILKNPHAILWDKKDKAVLYVFDIDGDRAYKLVVEIDYTVKGIGKRNAIVTAGKIPTENLNSGAYDLISGGFDGWK